MGIPLLTMVKRTPCKICGKRSEGGICKEHLEGVVERAIKDGARTTRDVVTWIEDRYGDVPGLTDVMPAPRKLYVCDICHERCRTVRGPYGTNIICPSHGTEGTRSALTYEFGAPTDVSRYEPAQRPSTHRAKTRKRLRRSSRPRDLGSSWPE